MFSDFDSDDLAKLGRLVGLGLFIIAFALPAVRSITNDYRGYFCAFLTAENSATGLAHLGQILQGNANGDEAICRLALIASGLISPLIVVSFFFRSLRIRRAIAISVLVLMGAPWIVFGLSNEPTGFGDPGGIHPLIGHYFWMIGGILIFTPEFVGLYRDGHAAGLEEPARTEDNGDA
jgi:hypothetical protein